MSMLRRLWLLSILLVTGLWLGQAALAGPGAEQRPLCPEDLWHVQRLGPPSLSPDGQWCAVEVTRWDIAKDESFSEIWLLRTDGRQQRQLTNSGGKNSQPKWSPDGRHIAFISQRAGDNQPQIYIIAPTGGEARRVSRLPFTPSALKWSADGKQLFFIAWTWPDTPDDDSHRRREQEQKQAKVKAYVIDDAVYRYWDRWLADGRRPFVFALDLAMGQHRNLLAGTGRHLPPYEPSAADYDVSPDGQELCFVAENVKEIGLDQNHDLFTVPLAPGSSRQITNLTADNPANDTHPVYSPDGKRLAFLRQRTKFFYADQTELMLVDRTSGKITPVWSKFDRSVASPVFAEQGRVLFFEVERDGFHYGYQLTLDGQASVPVQVTQGPSDRSFAPSADGGQLVYLRSSFDLPPTVMAQRLKGPQAAASPATPGADAAPPAAPAEVGGHAPEQAADHVTQLSHFNDSLVARWRLGRVENRLLKGYENRDVQTFIVYPPDFDPSRRWPVVQMVHGGPHNAFTNDWSFRWNPQVWAAQGWVIVIVNFHGSSGFGQEFADSITGDYGTKPLADILRTTEWLEQQPWVDKDRLAAAGASYGGYMMAYLNGHTDKFKAMVCHAGVYSYASQMASDIVVSRRRALGGFPWDDYARMDRQSANRFAQNFKTPTLVIHGEKDYRVPVTQGFEYFNTLKQKGVPTRLVYFPDENHWILKPQNSLLWHREVFAWLKKYIGSGPTG